MKMKCSLFLLDPFASNFRKIVEEMEKKGKNDEFQVNLNPLWG